MRALKIVVVGSLGLLVACSGGEKKTDEKPADKPAAEAPEAAAEEAAEPAGEPGTIKVTVAFEGEAPKGAALDRKADPYCAKTKVMDPSVMVNANKTLANVVVRLDKVRGKFDFDPTAKVEIVQKACMYEPRVQVAMKGQKVAITNGDTTLHNVHGYKGKNEQNWFNSAQPPNAPAISKDLKADDMVRFKCDVHPWMSSWISIADHPFQGVSGDTGDVTLANVPSRGKPYKLVTWHEKYGFKETEVKVEAGKTAEVKVTYSAADQQG